MALSESAQRWCSLNDWLSQYQSFWRPAPFAEPDPAWRRECPALADWLEGLSESALDRLQEDPAGLAAELATFIPGLAAWPDVVRVPDWFDAIQAEQATLPETLAVDMPGRKRIQAGAFAAAAAPLAGTLLDWCCGKGHLARTLVRQGSAAALGFEWQSSLVEDGNRLADRYQDPVDIHRQDVMAADLTLPEVDHAVALHACGDLHRQLITRAVSEAVPRLTFSPCCYHLTRKSQYQPLSDAARKYAETLRVDRSLLRLAVRETVTAPVRERTQGQRISVWRLGFDALQRHLRGRDEYRPVPSHPSRLNHGDFKDFCQWAAGKSGLEMPAEVDWPHWYRRGLERQRQVRRHELLRHLFRRPLELWLVLDYAVFLEEQGYRVRLGQFCERSLTPRNLMLDALRVP